MNQTFGYIYADTEQEAARQKEVLRKLSIPDANIFIDKQEVSGKERPRLHRMERRIKEDDLIYVKSLNGLGSSYDEILEQWQLLTKKQKADVAVLDTPLLDTRRGKEIMETFLVDVVSETLSFVAENEHEKNSRRQIESYHAAKAKGVRYGRPLSPLPENFNAVYQKWKAREITGVEAAKECGMPLSSFRYRAKQYEEGQKNLAKAQ